jgi:mycofactocin biosynthetic radical S-adenosylmethionine protein MftC
LKHSQSHNGLLKAPVNVTWEITRQCNLRCRHCLSADVMGDCESELDFDQCCDFINELDRLEIFQVNFGGGEPFLREDFLEILDYCHAKGITTCVSTNGTVLDESLVRKLKKMRSLYLQVSLDGATAETNDAIRGRGTFDRIMHALKLLVAHDFRNASTNTVVTGINFREIRQIYELGKQYGLKTRLSRFRPSGNAKRSWKDYRLRHDQLAELSVFLNGHRDIATGDSFFSIVAQERRGLGLNMCGAARMTCSVLPDGGVYPCAFLQDSLFKAGNIREQSLGLIWRNASIFRVLREIRIESCERCVRFEVCHGGCPAVAYYLSRSLNQPDPECMTAFHPYLSILKSNHGAQEHVSTV